MDAQGILTQKTYRQSKLYASCESYLTIVVLTEMYCWTFLIINIIYFFTDPKLWKVVRI